MVEEIDVNGRGAGSAASAVAGAGTGAPAGAASGSQPPRATSRGRAVKGIAASVVAGVSLVGCGTQAFGSHSNDKAASHPAGASALLGPASPEVSGSPGWPNSLGSTPPPPSVVKVAEHLLTLIKLPSGAVRESQGAAGTGQALSAPTDDPATPDLLDLHQFYLLSGRPQTALAWLKTHLPAGSRIVEQGAGGYLSGSIVAPPPGSATTGSTSSVTASGTASSGAAGVSSSGSSGAGAGSGSSGTGSGDTSAPPSTMPGGVIPTPASLPSPAPVQPSQVNIWFIGYGWSPADGVSTEELAVELVSAGHDKTAARIDSEVTWITPRPAAEIIPAGTRTLTISITKPLNVLVPPASGGGATGSASASGTATGSASASGTATAVPSGAPSNVSAGKSTRVTVTNPAKIRAIAAAIDSLPLFPAGVMACPMETGGQVVLTFDSGHGGAPLAVVSAGTSGCDVVSVTIGGRAEPALAGGAQLTAAVARILGLPNAALGGLVNVSPPSVGIDVLPSSQAG